MKYGDTVCFTNFRVVTSDCWASFHQQFVDYYGQGHDVYYYKSCDDFICCYSVFQVCYMKFPNDSISVVSFNRLDTLPVIPRQCIMPCFPNNCKLWSPFDNSTSNPPQGRIPNRDITSFTDDCEIIVSNNNNKDIINILLRCYEKGKVNIRMFDLLGNIVYSNEFLKENYERSFAFNADIKKGVYLIVIKLNEKIYGYKKILLLP